MNIPSAFVAALRSLAFLLIASFATPALADVDQCVEAHSQGQISRDDNRLIEAQALFLSCARDAGCPAPVREECEQYLTAVSQLTPTVVFAARDPDGQDLEGVRVYSNDEFLLDVGDTAPVAMNPGEYRIRFEDANGQTKEVKLLVLPGEKARVVSAVFTPQQSPASTPAPLREPGTPHQWRTISTYALGGLAVAGLAGFAIFGLQGKASEQQLRSSCAPDCSNAQKSAVASKYLLADISLAVFGVSAAGAAVLYFTPSFTASGDVASVGVRGVF